MLQTHAGLYCPTIKSELSFIHEHIHHTLLSPCIRSPLHVFPPKDPLLLLRPICPLEPGVLAQWEDKKESVQTSSFVCYI